MAILIALAVCLVPASCATAEAIEALPIGWWESTERLVIALFTDIWSVVTFFV